MRARTMSLIGAALLAACHDAPTPPRAVLTIAVSGRAERGSAVSVQVLRDDVVVAPAAYALTVLPADAATVVDGAVVLLRTGNLTLRTVAGSDTAETTLAVAAPPRIVFDAVAAGNRDIYSVALDGGELLRLTTSTADDAMPTAAGGTIVFSSRRDGNAELYAMPVTGGGEQRLTTSTTVNELFPALSADARSLAFVKDSARATRVWLAAANASNAAAASPASFGTAGSIETSPAWSPLMDRVVYVSTATPSGNAGVVVRAAAGGTPALVTGSGAAGPEVEPAVSPDGARVVVASSRAGLNGLYLRDLATGAVTTLREGDAAIGQPAWLADGRIVFTTFTAAGSTLAWIDPASPALAHDIPLAALSSAQHASALRP